MDEYIRAHNIDIPATADLVFDIIRAESDNRIICSYYFADHANRSIFWLDTYYADYFGVWSELRGATSASHVGESHFLYTLPLLKNIQVRLLNPNIGGSCIHAQICTIINLEFRYHCQLFPNCLPLTVELVDSMRDLLIYTIGGQPVCLC